LLGRFRDPICAPRIENRIPTDPYWVPNVSLRKKTAKCIEYKHTQSAQCRLVKTRTTEQFIASLGVEQQDYRHFPNTIIH